MKRLSVSILAILLAALGSGLTSANAVGDQKVVIQFAARVGQRDVDCGITYTNLGTTKVNAQISDFRFFISNVRLLDSKGAEVPLVLDQDNTWQYKTTSLLNFVGGKSCGETSMEQQNHIITGMITQGSYQGIVFDVGVPFELDHQNNTAAPSPLNVAAMFWTWQSGWKFVRIDMVTGKEKLEPWVIHLGSTGCESAAETTAPQKECAQPNRFTVRFDKFNAGQNTIVADLATLVAQTDLDHHKAMPPGCMSGPTDADCLKLIPTGFGLDLQTGIPSAKTPQRFLRME